MIEDQDKEECTEEISKDTVEPAPVGEPDCADEETLYGGLGDNSPSEDTDHLPGWISEDTPPEDPRQGWMKVILPGVMQMFGAMIGDPKIMLAPYLYCKIDGEAAFDRDLSVPMVALTDVILVRMNETQTPGKVVVHLHSLSQIHPENVNRCYVPAAAIPVIIPIKPDHLNVQKYINTVMDTDLIIPSELEVAKIIDVSGRAVEKR